MVQKILHMQDKFEEKTNFIVFLFKIDWNQLLDSIKSTCWLDGWVLEVTKTFWNLPRFL